ncbi:MAG TPA: hypothetical protein VGL56_01135 [Fimbriimonadaceae bacterium]|jgi:hypothetical protein
MPKLAITLLIAATAGLLNAAAAAQDKSVNPAERDALYAWFDSLGMNEVTKGQFIRLETWNVDQGKKQNVRDENGFTLTPTAKQFNLRDVSLRTEVVGYEGQEQEHHPVDLETFAKTILDTYIPQFLGQDATPDQIIASDSYELFVLSLALEARGDKNLADKLYARSHTLKPKYGDGYGMSYSEYIKGQIAEIVQPDLEEEVGDPKVTWIQALADIDAFDTHFPKTDSADALAKLRKSVAVVVEERKTHPILTPEEIKKLPVENQVRELIFQLPDQSDYYYISAPYMGLPNQQKEDKTPAGLLLKIGYPAVPQLIDALTDTRPTKSQYGENSGGLSGWNMARGSPPQQVNGVVQRILERLSGRTFQSQYSGMELTPAQVAAIQNNARTWWAEVKGKSEKDALIEQIQTDTPQNVNSECQRLAEIYPQDAAGPIEAAIKNPKNAQYRTGLLSIISYDKIPVSKEFRWDQMLHGDTLYVRLAALSLNLNSEKTETLDWLVSECKRTAAPGGEGIHTLDVIDVLSASNRTDAIELFQAASEKMNPDQLFSAMTGAADIQESAKAPPGYNSSLEKFIVPQLLNTKRTNSYGGRWEDLDLDNVRICDAALYCLSKRFPKKYKYAKADSLQKKDLLCYAAANVYRKENGLQPVTQPVIRKVTRAESCVVSEVKLSGSYKLVPLATQAALSLKGHALTADGLDSVIRATENHWPKELHQLVISASRGAYGEGVVLSIRFSTSAPVQNDWDFEEKDLLGGDSVQNSMGGGSQPPGPDKAKLASLLGSNPYQTFEILYSVSHKG